LAEIMNAWSGLDIFVVAILAALLEIQQFAAFIVGTSCDGINKYLEEYLNTALHGDDLCFDVVTSLYPAFAVLFCAAFFLFITSIPALRFCETALQDRIKIAHASVAKGKTNSIPDNEIYTAIDFESSKFGAKAILHSSNSDSISLGLLHADEMQKQCNVSNSGDDESNSVSKGCDGYFIGTYRSFNLNLFRFLWSHKLLQVHHVETTELFGENE